jgi:hypothetical protein
MKQRIQLRGICPVCFHEQAVSPIAIADHGYRIPQGWHARNGSCRGADQPHFGTVLGRKATEGEISRIRGWAEQQRDQAQKVRDGSANVWSGGRHSKIVEDPTQFQRNQYALHLESQADAAERAITALQNRVNGWREQAPREVTVEVKEAEDMTIHYLGKTFGRFLGKYCASSAMGAQRYSHRTTTTDRSKVTCENCLRRLNKQQINQQKGQS